MNSEAWKRTFKRADVNKDGRVDYQEFLLLCLDMETLVHSDSIKQLFSMYDGGSGKLSKEKLKQMIRPSSKVIGLAGSRVPNQEEIEAMWDKIMTGLKIDSDGNVSYEDFRDCLLVCIRFK